MIYDCFLYYDEDMLLEIRLHTLANYIDKFVIVESTHTFTGKPKPLNFNPDKFSEFKDKIIYIIFDRPPHTNTWQNEADTRNAIMWGLTEAKDNDLILVSDIDEIFNPELISKIKKSSLCTVFYQSFFNYQFNLQVFNSNGTPRLCKLPKAVNYRNLVRFFNSEPETLRNVKRKGSPVKANWFKWNWLKINTRIVREGGWHFSWIMSPDRIAEKMSTISHTEYDLPEFNNAEHINKVIAEAEDIWGRDRKFKVQALTSGNFPDYLVKNKDRFKSFIR